MLSAYRLEKHEAFGGKAGKFPGGKAGIFPMGRQEASRWEEMNLPGGKRASFPGKGKKLKTFPPSSRKLPGRKG